VADPRCSIAITRTIHRCAGPLFEEARPRSRRSRCVSMTNQGNDQTKSSESSDRRVSFFSSSF
jgi:hypothetical protein